MFTLDPDEGNIAKLCGIQETERIVLEHRLNITYADQQGNMVCECVL